MRNIIILIYLTSAFSVKAQLSIPFWFRAVPASTEEEIKPASYARFLETSQPLGFGTFDHGELSIAFRLNEKLVWQLKDWHEPPKPTFVFSDMLVLQGQPIADCYATLIFWTSGADLTLWDVQLLNKTQNELQVEIMPMLGKTELSWSDAKRDKDYKTLTANYLDGLQALRKVEFAQFKPADGLLGWNSIKGAAAELPFAPNFDTDVVVGQVLLPNGAPARAWPGAYLMQLICLGHPDTIYTERSGQTLQAFTDGSLSVKLGVLNAPNSQQIRFAMNSLASEKLGYEFLSPNQTDDFNVLLGAGRLPPAVETLTLDRRADARLLNWVPPLPDLRYNVYRRIYPGIEYVRIATNLKKTSFEDHSPSKGSVLGYVVVSINAGGMPGMHSPEANTLKVAEIAEQLQSPKPYIGLDLFAHPTDWMLANTLKGFAFYNRTTLLPNQKTQYRGFQLHHAAETPPQIDREALSILLSSDWSAFILEREKGSR